MDTLQVVVLIQNKNSAPSYEDEDYNQSETPRASGGSRVLIAQPGVASPPRSAARGRTRAPQCSAETERAPGGPGERKKKKTRKEKQEKNKDRSGFSEGPIDSLPWFNILL